MIGAMFAKNGNDVTTLALTIARYIFWFYVYAWEARNISSRRSRIFGLFMCTLSCGSTFPPTKCAHQKTMDSQTEFSLSWGWSSLGLEVSCSRGKPLRLSGGACQRSGVPDTFRVEWHRQRESCSTRLRRRCGGRLRLCVQVQNSFGMLITFPPFPYIV
jgi:hypothetical protein